MNNVLKFLELAIEANDEWLVGHAYMSKQSMGPRDLTPGRTQR